MERRKSRYGLREYLGTLTAPFLGINNLELWGRVSGDSMMELERPGEEKKKRWEAKTAARSGSCDGGRVSQESEEEKQSVDLEVEELASWKVLKRNVVEEEGGDAL